MRLTRAGEWWEYKLAPVFALYYATHLAYRPDQNLSWRDLLWLLAALGVCAAYVGIINDLTDKASDARAGKANRQAGISRRTIGLILVALIGAGAAIAYVWRANAALVTAYAGAWVAFSLYSIPPARLKTRGLAGVAADAAGAHLFPTLTAVFLASKGAPAGPDAVWVAATGVWAFAYGVRGILWHQFLDLENDRRALEKTFVARSPRLAAHLGASVIIPIELAAFGVVLWRLDTAWLLAGVAAYGGLVLLRVRLWSMRPVVVRPRPRYMILMHEYYGVFLPLSLLLVLTTHSPVNAAVLVAHLVVFPRRMALSASDLARLLVEVVRRRVRRWWR